MQIACCHKFVPGLKIGDDAYSPAIASIPLELVAHKWSMEDTRGWAGKNHTDTDIYLLRYWADWSVCGGLPRRLTKGCEGFPGLKITLLTLDYDRKTCGRKWPWSGQDDISSAVSAMLVANPLLTHASVVAPSRNGLRVVFVLDEPIEVKFFDSLWGQVRDSCSKAPEITGLEFDDAVKDWTRLTRIPFGVRDGRPVGDEFFSRHALVDLSKRLKVSDFQLTESVVRQPRVRQGYTASKASESSTLPAPACPPDIRFDPEVASKGWDNYVYCLVKQASDARPTDTRAELMARLDGILGRMTELDKSNGRRDWRAVAWDKILRNHTPLVCERDFDTPESVDARMDEIKNSVVGVKGRHLLRTPPGSSKSSIGIAYALAAPYGAVWCAPSRRLRDEAELRLIDRDPSLLGSIGIRRSNEELLVTTGRASEEHAKKLSERYSSILHEAREAVFKGRSLNKRLKQVMRVSKETGDWEEVSFFEWLAKPVHGHAEDKPAITEKTAQFLQRARRDNDKACYDSRFIFTTHDGLMPMAASFNRILNPKDPEEVAAAKEEVRQLKALGVEGLMELIKAKRKLSSLTRDDDAFTGRYFVWDEVEPCHFIDPRGIDPEVEFSIYGKKHAINLFDPWDSERLAERFKFLQSKSVLFISADRGTEQAAARNGFPLDSVYTADDIRILDRDLWVIQSPTNHKPAKEIVNSLPKSVKDELHALFMGRGEVKSREPYYQRLDAILEEASERERVANALNSVEGLIVVCSGKKHRAKRRGEFLEVETSEPLSKLNSINVVGSNEYLSSRMGSCVPAASPEAVGQFVGICGLEPETALRMSVANAAAQVVSRNTGCRGTPFVEAYCAKNDRELPQDIRNLHILVTPELSYLDGLVVEPPLDQVLTREIAPPEHAPIEVKLAHEAIFRVMTHSTAKGTLKSV